MKEKDMSSISPLWIGFTNIETLNPQFTEKNFDVLCLPENIENTNASDKLIETIESIELYKILKSQGINVLALHDLGIKAPFYDRRSDDIYLGILLIKEIAVPIVLGVVSNWISNKLRNSTIHLDLKILKPEKIISLNYDGDGETLKQILDSLKHSENEERYKNS